MSILDMSSSAKTSCNASRKELLGTTLRMRTSCLWAKNVGFSKVWSTRVYQRPVFFFAAPWYEDMSNRVSLSAQESAPALTVFFVLQAAAIQCQRHQVVQVAFVQLS